MRHSDSINFIKQQNSHKLLSMEEQLLHIPIYIINMSKVCQIIPWLWSGNVSENKHYRMHLMLHNITTFRTNWPKTPQTLASTPSVCGRGKRAGLTGVLPSDRVVMLIDALSLSEDREGGEGLLFSRISCVCRKSRQSCWILMDNISKDMIDLLTLYFTV